MRFVGRAPRRYWLIALGVIVFAGLPTQVTSFQSLEWAEVLIFAIVIMGLNLLIGYSGQISLGHGAFMAVGAYTTAILVHRYHVEYLVTIPIAGLDRKSTRLNSSHLVISYAVFCLKKKKTPHAIAPPDQRDGREVPEVKTHPGDVRQPVDRATSQTLRAVEHLLLCYFMGCPPPGPY